MDKIYKSRTRALFHELVSLAEDRSEAVYTLNTEDKTTIDGKVLPSIYRLYLEESDPSEVRFANKYFVNWDHWQAVCKVNDFKPYLIEMRKALTAKLRHEALEKLREIANNPADKNYYNALRFLETAPWERDPNAPKEVVKEVKKVGRPSNSPEQVETMPDVSEDLRKLNKFYGTRQSKTN